MARPLSRQLRAVARLCLAGALGLVAGLAFYGWSQYHQGQLQAYQADVVAPVTARADILPLYAQSPFGKMEIEFPVAEISERYTVRLWASKDRAGREVEAELLRYLERFYTASQTRIDVRLSSIELELRSMQAEQRAKIYEMEYLRQHYAELRAQRIEQLHQEVRALGRGMEEKKSLLLSAPDASHVTISAFEPISARRMVTALALRGLLAGLFAALLVLLWQQRNRSGDVPR